ncbi:MAG: 50S ribosomal protein L30 [Candidatus Diapherotrites archaeon]|nr:50S ribosomal protein L30 [Candidatus Diapherotrites archaeon]
MLAVIRIRGNVNVDVRLKRALEVMMLHSKNHLVLVPEGPSSKRMLGKVRDYVTFGEVNAETLARLLEKRGRLEGNKPLAEAYLKEKKTSFKELAQDIIGGKTSVRVLGIKPVFRLNSPSKGFERGGIKLSYNMGGVLGYRAQAINALIERMM